MNMLPSILEACEYRMQTRNFLTFIQEMAENNISERLIFKISGGAGPQTPYRKTLKRDSNLHLLPFNLAVIRYITSEVIFKTG